IRVEPRSGRACHGQRFSRWIVRYIRYPRSIKPFMEYFDDGCVVDQPFQTRLGEGVVRCYMAGDRCAGFGHQKVKALVDAPAARAEAGPRLYTSHADPDFQRLCRLME